MTQDICVVIPTLNESATITSVVSGVLPYCGHVLIVDGGSTDGTIQLVEDVARNDVRVRLEIFREPGKGRALRHALKLVSQKVTVFIDADGSHDPSDIPALMVALEQGEADLCVGSRWEGGSDELHGDMNKWLRRSGSRVLTGLVNLRFRSRMTDIQNGFRAVDTAVCRDIGLESDDFTIEQEMVMKFLAGGYRVRNVPSHEYARQGGTAKLNLGKVWFRFGVVVLLHLFGISRPRTRRVKEWKSQ